MASMASGDINKMASEAANENSMLMVVDTDPDNHQHHHNHHHFNQFKPVENQFKPVEDERGCSPLGATPPDGNVNIDVESHHEGHSHAHAHHIHNMAGLSMKYGVYSSVSKSPPLPSALEIAPAPPALTVAQTAASESIEAVSAASGVNWLEDMNFRFRCALCKKKHNTDIHNIVSYFDIETLRIHWLLRATCICI